MTPAAYINIGTLTLIVAMIALHVRTFIKGGKDPKILLSGLGGVIVGSSLAMCVGGALSSIAMYIAGGGNGISGIAPWATGTGDRAIAAGSASGLSMEGGIIAAVVAVLGWVTIRDADKTKRLRLIGGLFCGVCLTYTAGYGGLVDDSLIPFYNGLGAQLIAAVERLF
ncbi:hypothetical protein [Streptomyces sp. NPDC102437]|uniref:hypothetical protein n=1 Tax=Streptomyces sp. NPDC102437 TaxID=3366175 RepID=UPI00380C742B